MSEEEAQVPKVISIEDAKATIEAEKKQRVELFIEEYKTLCDKYQCEIFNQGLVVIPK